MKKPWITLIAIALAIFVGSIISQESWLYSVFDVGGTLFIQALTLVVVPLVMASIITGVARIASEAQFGRLGIRIFVTFILINLTAILIGVFLGNVVQPGLGVSWPGTHELPNPALSHGSLGRLFLEIVPPNILDAFAKGKMLGLIFFSILFGYALTQISKKAFQTHLRIWQGILEGMFRIIHGIMYLLPLGVFCLVAKVFAQLGIETLRPLGTFVWAALVGFALFAFGAIPLILKFFGNLPFRPYLKAISPALITAFSTSSSTATLPIALECMEERAGVSNRICSLVIPLGTSINLSGTALYNAFGGLFIAQVFGVDMPFATQISLVLASLFISFGVASIPGGGLVGIIALLSALNLPAEGIALFIALDRLLDMFRTGVNVFSYTTSALLIAKGEKEKLLTSKKMYTI